MSDKLNFQNKKTYRFNPRKKYNTEYNITPEEAEDLESFKGIAQHFNRENPLLAWDLKTNLERIERQMSGDTAFYFLAVISFIEGFIRDYYGKEEAKFTFDKKAEEKVSRSVMFRHMKQNLPGNKPITREQERVINIIYNLMLTHSDYTEDEKELPNISYYIDGDRIRHNFTQQTKNNMRLLLIAFSEFAKIFGFYNDNIELFRNLISDDNYFLSLKTHQKEDVEELEEDFYNAQLLKALYALTWRNYQQAMSTLTEEQQAVSDKLLSYILKDRDIAELIKGGPGTGKTLILINLLQQTLDKNIKLLTYSDSLTKYNKYLAGLISFNGTMLNASDKKKLSDRIECFDDYFTSIFTQILKKHIVHLDEMELPVIGEICKKYRISPRTLFREAIEIWLNLPTEQKYIDRTYCQKTEEDEKIQEKRKNVYLRAVTELRKYFDANWKDIEDYPLELAFYKTKEGYITIPDKLKLDYLLIDEVQDLEAAKIETIIRSCRNGFVMTGDRTQSIFVRKGLPWDYLEDNFFETTNLKLTKNFRSTVPIQDLAEDYKELITVKDDETASEGFLPGPYPEVYLSKSAQAVYDKIVDEIYDLKDKLNFENKDFCIIAPNKSMLEELGGRLGKAVYLENKTLDFEKNDDLIKLSRFKYVKGIDLPVVMVILDKSFINKKENDNLDTFGQENGIYTCISRAMNLLQIYFIDDDGELLKEEDDPDEMNSVYKLYSLVKDSVVELPEGSCNE